MESTSYVISLRMVFFYLVTTGWIFNISLLCENPINLSNIFDSEVDFLVVVRRHLVEYFCAITVFSLYGEVKEKSERIYTF